MPFSELTKDQAFRRSNGQCECRRQSHPGHRYGRCMANITRYYGTEFHHVVSQKAGGSDGLQNCEALCINCHHLTDNYGGY